MSNYTAHANPMMVLFLHNYQDSFFCDVISSHACVRTHARFTLIILGKQEYWSLKHLEGKESFNLWGCLNSGLPAMMSILKRIWRTRRLLLCLITCWQIAPLWPCAIASKPGERQQKSLCEWNWQARRLRGNSLIIKGTPLLFRCGHLRWMGCIWLPALTGFHHSTCYIAVD